jgi:AraC-like DNA-binding protein/ligand-binding sensor protein
MESSSSHCAACLELQREFQRRLSRKLGPQQACCFAGLTEVAVPVIVGGKHVATLMAGKVFQKRPTRGRFESLAQQLRAWGIGTDLREARKAYFKVPIVPARQFHGAVGLLTILARHLAESASRLLVASSSGEPAAVTRVKQFVLAHARESLTLKQAAQQACLSRYYLCKNFKQSTGMTFTEFVARVRVERAGTLLSDPKWRITDVAERAGFQSISQFNRVFRRYAGASPTRFRKALRTRRGGASVGCARLPAICVSTAVSRCADENPG